MQASLATKKRRSGAAHKVHEGGGSTKDVAKEESASGSTKEEQA